MHIRLQNLHRRVVPSIALSGLCTGIVLMLVSVVGSTLSPTVQASSKQAGEALFREKGCQHCHGADANGTDLGPDLSSIGKQWKKDRIEQQIVHGGGGMPPFGEALQRDEVASLVEFLHAKRKPVKRSQTLPGQPRPAGDDSGL